MWTIGKYKANLQSGYGSQQSLSPVSIPSFGRIANASIFGVIIVAVLAIFMVAALVAPLFFIFIGLLYVAKVASEETRGI